MIEKLIHFAVYRRGVVFFLIGLLIVCGAVSLRSLPIDAVPDITNNQVVINTSVQGLAPEEIERSITIPLEIALQGIPGAIQVRSLTRFGLSQITIVYEDSVNIYQARQLVLERIIEAQSSLPQGAFAKIGPISTGLGEIYHYHVEFDKIETDPNARYRQLVELYDLQEWFIRPRLLSVHGLADVNSMGGFQKQFHIQPRLSELTKYGLHFEDIITALDRTNQNVGGGYVEQDSESFLIQGLGLFASKADIQRVPVKSLETLRTITIGDIAHVKLGKQLRTGAASVSGQEAVIGVAMMLAGENSRTVAHRVGEKIEEIQRELPSGVRINTLYDRSKLVDATLRTVEHNLFMGALLVILVLFFMVGNLRAALITAITIPITLLITFLPMRYFGISGNLMSLGALDFGIIVDGTVIVIDNCVRVLRERAKAAGRELSTDEIKKGVYDAAVEIRHAAGFGELIIVVSLLPILGLLGIEGKMFRPMAATFSLAILVAVLLSFTLAPALASIIFTRIGKSHEPVIMVWIRNHYIRLLNFALLKTKWVFALAGASVILGIFLFSGLGGEFLPQLQEGAFALEVVRPVQTSLTQSLAYEAKTQEILKNYKEVELVFSRTGNAVIASDAMGIHQSDTFIMLKKRDQWPYYKGKKLSYPELATKIKKDLQNAVPGQDFIVSQPIEMRFNELLEGIRTDVSVKIFGPNLGELMRLSQEIKEVIEKVSGAGDVETELSSKSPVLQIKPKEDILKSQGISGTEVLEAVSMALGGQQVGFLYEGEKRYPILLRLAERDRSNLDLIRSLPISVAPNTNASLNDVADIEFKDTFGTILRENARRRVAVLVNPRGRDTEGFVQEAQVKVSEQVKLPEGYSLEWGGDFKNLREAKLRLLILAPLALLLVFAMIFFVIRKIRDTFLVFLGVPLALVGGVLGLIFAGLPFSVSAGVGFIALFGIAVLNGLVLVHFFIDLRNQKNNSESLTNTISAGTLIRLRPVLMTALVDIFGFLPMIFSHGIGSEVQRPLASVIVGGVISSTILTLIVIPVAYLYFNNNLEKIMNKK